MVLRAQPTRPVPARAGIGPKPPRPSALRPDSRRLRLLAALLLATTVAACSRHIEDDPPTPEHRLAPCETWCALMFDPVCPAQDVEVKTEEECFEGCIVEKGVWAPVDGEDECAATFIRLVDCLASLPCDELQGHFATINSLEDVPASEWSSCGELARAQLDCQSAHY